MQRILVIEDNAEISAPLISLLQNSGFITKLYEQGDLVLNALQQFKPELILLDLRLPTISGLEVCRRVRLMGNVPIIIISAEINQNVKLKAFELGADDFISKPFSMSELLLRINSVLKRSISTRFS